jgi:multisubunit Na+/H+ antiporter MnhC subunit
MNNNLLKNWDVPRFIRLAAGIGIGIYAIVSRDYLWLWLAGMSLFQAVLNLSCCEAGGCRTGGRTGRKPLYRDQIETYNPKKHISK